MNTYYAELLAIFEATKQITKLLFSPIHFIWEVSIYSDSQAALKVLRNPQQQCSQPLIRKTLEITHAISAQTGLRINFHWVPGHAGIKGNEDAHILAQQAMIEGKQTPTTVCLKTVML